ncbi:MAG: peptidoglycan-binding protein [Bryobacteraceae bacterium]
MPSYTVKQGDCISSIAHETGFFWDTLWNHPGNARLKQLRRNPNALLPGDVVLIPDKRPKEESCDATRLHRFRIKGVPVRFNLQLLDVAGDPRSDVPYTLEVDGSSRRGRTDSDGRISEIVPPPARRAKLTLGRPGRPKAEVYEFQLGHMNPIDDIAGLQARLQNLGYLKKVTGEMDAATQGGLWKFQRACGLPETGEPDAATHSALAGKHGG